jgi:hypothetical protein
MGGIINHILNHAFDYIKNKCDRSKLDMENYENFAS